MSVQYGDWSFHTTNQQLRWSEAQQASYSDSHVSFTSKQMTELYSNTNNTHKNGINMDINLHSKRKRNICFGFNFHFACLASHVIPFTLLFAFQNTIYFRVIIMHENVKGRSTRPNVAYSRWNPKHFVLTGNTALLDTTINVNEDEWSNNTILRPPPPPPTHTHYPSTNPIRFRNVFCIIGEWTKTQLRHFKKKPPVTSPVPKQSRVCLPK